MKLTQFNTKIFTEELTALQELADEVKKAATAWLEAQEERSFVSPALIQGRRQFLETKLNEYREKSATVYDFQGDRGMCDFIPTGFTVLEEIKEEDEEEEWENMIDLGYQWGDEVVPVEVPVEEVPTFADLFNVFGQ